MYVIVDKHFEGLEYEAQGPLGDNRKLFREAEIEPATPIWPVLVFYLWAIEAPYKFRLDWLYIDYIISNSKM